MNKMKYREAYRAVTFFILSLASISCNWVQRENTLTHKQENGVSAISSSRSKSLKKNIRKRKILSVVSEYVPGGLFRIPKGNKVLFYFNDGTPVEKLNRNANPRKNTKYEGPVENTLIVSRLNTDCKLVDIRTGDLASKTIFRDCSQYTDEYIVVSEIKEGSELWGIIHPSGEYIVEPGFKGIEFVDKDIFIASKNTLEVADMYRLGMDTPILEKLSRTGYFSNELCSVYRPTDQKSAFVNRNGKTITEWFEETRDFREGLAAIKKNKKWGFINTKGKIVIKPRFWAVKDFYNGLAAVRERNKKKDNWGFINAKGKIVIEAQYNRVVHGFAEGLAVVSNKEDHDSKLGYIDSKGKMAIDVRFKQAQPFSEGLAAVMENDKWGFIDKSGKYVIETVFESVMTWPSPTSLMKGFSGGISVVSKDGENFFAIDKEGNCVVSCE